MGALVQCYYKVYTKNGDVWEYQISPNWPNDEHSNLLTSGKTTSKISIQAPPGTIVQIEGKDIIIGRSGIFDFDNEDISVSSLLFPAGVDNTAQREAASRLLAQVREDLRSDADPQQTNDSALCVNLKNQYTSKEYTTWIIQDGQQVNFSVIGIAGVIAAYQEAEEDTGVQNLDLKNIIVNYIEND